MHLFFSIGLTLALLAALVGTALRLRHALSAQPRGRHLIAAILRGGWLAGLIDALLLRRTWRTDGPGLRWSGHTLLILGFLPLLVLHAMDGIVTARIFSGYEPTLDPWQLLRNLCGLCALSGLGLLLWHRLTRLRTVSGLQDWLLLALLGGILLSGFVLEAAKITSADEFARMQADYFPEAAPEELAALQLYWQTHNGVRFDVLLPRNPDSLSLGATLHADRCEGCHAPTGTAFVSRTLAALAPPSLPCPARAHVLFWYLHVGLAFLTLGLLPWGKFLHPLSATAHLLVRSGKQNSSAEQSDAAGRLALEACTRCGQCSLHCSVAPSHTVLHNPDILPMTKLADLRCHLHGDLDEQKTAALVEGSHICTECLRCTAVCPAGIDLQQLWLSSKRELTDSGRAGVDGEIRKRTAGQWARDLAGINGERIGTGNAGLADQARSFWGCVQCTTCTSVCPVVAVSPDPARDLDLTPQQIMNLLRMGLKAQTLGARMVWSCTTCYKCQEHCPQEVPVADILYELRNLGAAALRSGEDRA